MFFCVFFKCAARFFSFFLCHSLDFSAEFLYGIRVDAYNAVSALFHKDAAAVIIFIIIIIVIVIFIVIIFFIVLGIFIVVFVLVFDFNRFRVAGSIALLFGIGMNFFTRINVFLVLNIAQQLIQRNAEKIRNSRHQLNIGIGSRRFPFADGLNGHSEFGSKLFLCHSACLTQLAQFDCKVFFHGIFPLSDFRESPHRISVTFGKRFCVAPTLNFALILATQAFHDNKAVVENPKKSAQPLVESRAAANYLFLSVCFACFFKIISV